MPSVSNLLAAGHGKSDETAPEDDREDGPLEWVGSPGTHAGRGAQRNAELRVVIPNRYSPSRRGLGLETAAPRGIGDRAAAHLFLDLVQRGQG
jgi:hypothetical protein